MRRTRGVLLGLIGTLVAPTLAAQDVPAPGTRVRVLGVARQPAIATGAFVRLAGDTVVLTDSAGTTRAVTLQPGRRWEISTGMHRRTLQGMGIGLLVGAGTGALLGAATYQPPDCPPQSFWRDLCVVVSGSAASRALTGAVVLGVPAMVIGGLAGSEKRERWRPVTTVAPRVALLPTGWHSAALAVSISF